MTIFNNKIVSHFFRNVYLFTIVYFLIFLSQKIQLSLYSFLLGLVTYTVAYAPIYFLNDFVDAEEDIRYHKVNLFNSFHSPVFFWFLSALFLITGIGLIYVFFPLAALALVLCAYCLNIAYSCPPFRLRNRPGRRETLIFILNIIKFYLIALFLGLSLQQTPLLIASVCASFAAVSLALYKLHYHHASSYHTLWFAVFIFLAILACLQHPLLSLFFLPLIPISYYLMKRYRSTQIPLGIFQLSYFLYAIMVFITINALT